MRFGSNGGGSITSSGTVRSWAGSSNNVVLKASGQIRTQSIEVTYIVDAGGGDVTPDPVDVEEPTFNYADGSTFD